MSRPASIEDFQRLIRKLGRLLRALVTEKLSAKRKQRKWASAFIEARWTSDSDTPWRLGRLRVVLPNNKRPTGIHSTDAMERILAQIAAMRDELFPDRCYGLKLTIFPDSPPQIDLNKDPDRAVDPQWFRE